MYRNNKQLFCSAQTLVIVVAVAPQGARLTAAGNERVGAQ